MSREIDYNTHFLMPHHLDYTSFHEDGSLKLHATFDSSVSSEEISASFAEMAQRIEKSPYSPNPNRITVRVVELPEKLFSLTMHPPASLTAEAILEYQIKTLREEAEKAKPL